MKRTELTEAEKEFADYVDTHDTAAMIDSGELEEIHDIKIDIPVRKKPITMKIYPALLARVKEIATHKQMPYQSLINQWIAERAYQEDISKKDGGQ